MKGLILCLILSTISSASAGPIIALGGGLVLEHESEQERNNKSLVEMGSGFSFGFGAELFPGPLTLNLGLNFLSAEANTQYSYKGSSLSDLNTDATNTYALLGPRWRFIYTQSFTTFIGAGPVLGSLSLDYDQVPAGAKSKESQSYKGYYLEAGSEIILNANHAFRFTLSRNSYSTEKFATLGDKALSMNYLTVGVVYMLNLGH